jgi:hypothetical protein
MFYQEFSLAAQTAYAGLDGAARQWDLNRGVSDVPGGFAKKTVAGREYWYHQMKDANGKVRQTYVGPDDDATRSVVASHGDPQKLLAHAHLVRLAKSAIALGCADIPTKHARVIERLADAGLFSAGGILVGTHAFLAYQNIFGVRWESGAATLDLDFAHAGRNLSLALPSNLKVDTPEAIDSLQMGFIPNAAKTSYRKVDEPDFDLDFLTSRGRKGDAHIYIKDLNLTLQPLRFMELSLEDPIRATLVARNGPIVVNLPRPERYALHKMMISGERPQAQRVKAKKDMLQAAALLAYLLENDLEALRQQWVNIHARGAAWRKSLMAGAVALEKAFTEIPLQAAMV